MAGVLTKLSNVWPFSYFISTPNIEFINGIPRNPDAEKAMKRFSEMSIEEIEAIPIDPEIKEIFDIFEEHSKVINENNNG